MDPIYNCILAVCCPEDSPEQLAALTRFLESNGATNAEGAAMVILKHFDLAPKDSLRALKDAISELARGANYQG